MCGCQVEEWNFGCVCAGGIGGGRRFKDMSVSGGMMDRKDTRMVRQK